MALEYPRFIHSEFLTHRAFSRNASSSRAIPVGRMISDVLKHPQIPVSFGQNQRGMQAGEELPPFKRSLCHGVWRLSSKLAAMCAWAMSKLGVHKQVANRVLEPYQTMRTLVTATDWDNFFEQRCHKDADPNMQRLAGEMRYALNRSVPVERDGHYPYIRDNEFLHKGMTRDVFVRVSVARCARVSYFKHDGTAPTIEEDLALYDRLVGSKPMHLSPAEHVCDFMSKHGRYANFRGWKSHRKVLEERA